MGLAVGAEEHPRFAGKTISGLRGTIWGNSEAKIYLLGEFWRRLSATVEDFRSRLVPKERSGNLYLNHHYDFRFGVAMCFEKRFGVEREEASSEITLTLVAIEAF